VAIHTGLDAAADDLSSPNGGITNSLGWMNVDIDANRDGDIGIDTPAGEISAEEPSTSENRADGVEVNTVRIIS
jgi:hypothetical protein